MVKIAETQIILFITFLLAFAGLVNFYLPTEYQFVNSFDFFYLTSGIIGISGACVIVSGIPCAIAIGIFGLTGIFQYILVSGEWIKILIFTPLITTLIYVISRLGRGGG